MVTGDTSGEKEEEKRPWLVVTTVFAALYAVVGSGDSTVVQQLHHGL